MFYRKLFKAGTRRKIIKMKHGRKISGGRYHGSRKKKLYEAPGIKRVVRLGEEKKKTVRTTGGSHKTFLFKVKSINVSVSGKMKKVEIKNVVETPSNRFLARQNVITKGTIVETELGRVKITNRPSQESVLNGVLVE